MGKEHIAREGVQRHRAKRAASVILAACLLMAMGLAASCAAESRASDGGGFAEGALGASNSSYVATVWDGISDGTSLDDVLSQAGFRCVDSSNAPAWFEREVAPVAAFDRIFANGDETLFELQMAKTQESASEAMYGYMAGNGWRCNPSGMIGLDTFTKAEGELRWAMLEYSEADGMCCMVLHIQPS